MQGANILVDNKGCIKLADFGASKQVVELVSLSDIYGLCTDGWCLSHLFPYLLCFLKVTLSGAKSMKGTPYWMAPEVIRQTGHSLYVINSCFPFLCCFSFNHHHEMCYMVFCGFQTSRYLECWLHNHWNGYWEATLESTVSRGNHFISPPEISLGLLVIIKRTFI